MKTLIESGLVIHHSHKMSFDGELATYDILGSLNLDLSNLKITLHLRVHDAPKKHRIKLDLYNFSHVERFARDVSESEGLSFSKLMKEIGTLTDLLENYREEKFNEIHRVEKPKPVQLSITKQKEAIAFLEGSYLLKNIGKTLGETGIVGEEENRLLLFLIAISYKLSFPLHGILQSSSASGKSHLINAIGDCIPKEDVLSLSRITSKSLYHYRGDDLMHKLILIQDMDGLDEEALYGLRELQSLGELSSSITYKDKLGNLTSRVNHVKAHFSSLSATTKSEIYFDNLSRSILVRIDESEDQTHRILHYQNQKLSGLFDSKKEEESRQLLSNCIHVLKPFQVLNPYADKISLPLKAKALRRLNGQFQQLVCVITFLHQYQRPINEENKLISTKNDIKLAIEVFFDSIWLKIDDLDAVSRRFYEDLKTYVFGVKKAPLKASKSFTQREVRQAFNLSKTQTFRHLKTLLQMEYVSISGGSANRGFKYKLTVVDDYANSRDKVKQQLLSQLKSIK